MMRDMIVLSDAFGLGQFGNCRAVGLSIAARDEIRHTGRARKTVHSF
jgi:hypothetical protein